MKRLLPFLLVVSAAAAHAALTTTPLVESRCTTTLRIHAGVDRAFEFFTPTGEKAWAGHEWNPQRLGGGSGPDAEGMTFRNGSKDAVWVVVKLDRANHVVDYANFNEHVMTRIHIEVVAAGANEATATVAYHWNALVAEANAFVQHHDAICNDMVAEWGEKMNDVVKSEKR